MFHQMVCFMQQQKTGPEDTKVRYETDKNCAPNSILFAEPSTAEMENDLSDPVEKSRLTEVIKSEYSDEKSIGSSGLNSREQKRAYAEEQPMVDDAKGTESSEPDEDRNAELEKIVPKYFHMACDLCDYKFASWLTAKEHYLQQHNIQRAYLKCCNKKYIMRGRILHHVSWHIDPNAFT